MGRIKVVENLDGQEVKVRLWVVGDSVMIAAQGGEEQTLATLLTNGKLYFHDLECEVLIDALGIESGKPIEITKVWS